MNLKQAELLAECSMCFVHAADYWSPIAVAVVSLKFYACGGAQCLLMTSLLEHPHTTCCLTGLLPH